MFYHGCLVNWGIRQEKRSQRSICLGLETAWWSGGLPREGVGVEEFIPSLESAFPPSKTQGKQTLSPGCPGNLAGMSQTPGVFKKFLQKKFVLKQGRVSSQSLYQGSRLCLFSSPPSHSHAFGFLSYVGLSFIFVLCQMSSHYYWGQNDYMSKILF